MIAMVTISSTKEKAPEPSTRSVVLVIIVQLRQRSEASAQQVIKQVWISTHFGVLSEQLPVADENILFIKTTVTPAPVPL